MGGCGRWHRDLNEQVADLVDGEWNQPVGGGVGGRGGDGEEGVGEHREEGQRCQKVQVRTWCWSIVRRRPALVSIFWDFASVRT